jgi:hypothetical protein
MQILRPETGLRMTNWAAILLDTKWPSMLVFGKLVSKGWPRVFIRELSSLAGLCNVRKSLK